MSASHTIQVFGEMQMFKGFHMTNENGKYVLEFIIYLQGGK